MEHKFQRDERTESGLRHYNGSVSGSDGRMDIAPIFEEPPTTMKSKIFAAITLAGVAVAATAQTAAKPATNATKPHTATTAHATAAGPKLPPGIPPIKAPAKNYFPKPIKYFYQDQVIGTGAPAEPGQLYTLHYTGYFATDGTKFDSSHDHPEAPVMDKDGKPELDKDGKPVKAAGQPIKFLQGSGRTIPGFDMAFDGMKVGGKRRIFIPWQLGYGERGVKSPDPKNHPDIAPRTDLIFDVELLDVAEPPARPQMRMNMQGHPGMPNRPGMPNHPMPQGRPGQPAQPNAAPATGTTGVSASPQANTPSAAPASSPAATPTTPAASPANPASQAPSSPSKPSDSTSHPM